MRVIMAQFKIKANALEHFEAARDKILTALSQERPKGVRYIWCKVPDGTSFVGWLELDEGVENPLPGMEAGREFMEQIRSWVVEPPIREELRIVRSYCSVNQASQSTLY